MSLWPNEGKLRDSKFPCRTVAAKKLRKQTQQPNVWQVSLGIAEPAAATIVVILAVY
jgi:hypothetical protein